MNRTAFSMSALPITVMALSASASPALAGPDLIVGSIDAVTSWGSVGDTRAYSTGITLCNVGDAPASVDGFSADHPVIALSMFRYDPSEGSFVQLGVSGVFHTSTALQGTACSACTPSGSFFEIGAGCSTVEGSALIGIQGDLGPRSEVDAYYSGFQYPFTGINQQGDAVFKRLQVKQSDLLFDGARYFIEAVVVSSDDGASGAQNNNVSFREISINPSTLSAAPVGSTTQSEPVISAWHLLEGDGTYQEIDIPGQGVVHFASLATDLGDGSYRYDYNIYNQNLDANIDRFVIPTDAPVNTYTFSSVEHHSTVDSMIDNSGWSSSVAPLELSFEAQAAADPALRNVVRWGTMHTISFVSEAEPTISTVSVRAAGTGQAFEAAAFMPSVSCAPDLDGDGMLSFFDVSAFLLQRIDWDGNTVFDFFDVVSFLSDYGAGCP